MVNSAQWADLYNDIQPGYYSQDAIDKYRTGADPDLYPNVNWIDALYNDLASNQRVNLSITGGTDIVKYYIQALFIMKALFLKVPVICMTIIRLFIMISSIFVLM